MSMYHFICVEVAAGSSTLSQPVATVSSCNVMYVLINNGELLEQYVQYVEIKKSCPKSFSATKKLQHPAVAETESK